MLPVLKFIQINHALIVAHTLRNVIRIRNLHFDIKRVIGISIFNVDIKADTFGVSASFDNFFAFRVVDRFDFQVKNEFEKALA